MFLTLIKKRNVGNILVINHLYKAFGKNKVLIDFNLKIEKGESVVVLGKSGSGKSVLIKCIIGLLKPDKGNIEMFGENIPDLKEEELDKIRAKVEIDTDEKILKDIQKMMNKN